VSRQFVSRRRKEKNKNKNSDIRYFRTTGRKQHDFPKVIFTLDGWNLKAYGALFYNWK
jgi:hypothetical protein